METGSVGAEFEFCKKSSGAGLHINVNIHVTAELAT